MQHEPTIIDHNMHNTPTAIFLLCLAAAAMAVASAPLIPAATLTPSTTQVQALLSFRRNLEDPLGALDGWNPTTPSAPCDWRGVRCSSATHQVYEIRLPRLHLRGRLVDSLACLRQLRRLSLHSNRLNGSIPSSFSSLLLLRAVYLHNNSISGVIPPALLRLGNLQVLSLASNRLSGTLAGVWFSSSLRFLDLSFNDLSGDVPGNFTPGSQLLLVNLSFNRFSGQIPASIGNLQRLQFLWLDSNLLSGTLPSAISNCSMLVQLTADDNMIGGQLPATIGAMPALALLSLKSNSLSGSIPSSIFGNASSLFGPSSLRFVSLAFNSFTGLAPQPPELGLSSRLEVLDIGGNHIGGGIPLWWTNITSLRVVDLSGNSFSGHLPAGIGNLAILEELRVANNLLNGQVPVGIVKCGSIRVLDLEGNGFSGPLPVFSGQMGGLRVLSLGRNSFSGSIGPSLAGLHELEVLNLSENELTGAVPKELMTLGNLTTLNLSKNRFSGGESPANLGDLKRLVALNLSGCGFSGPIPASIGSLVGLTSLDLSHQDLHGEIPDDLFGLPSLQVVALQENRLHGDVPEGISSLATLRYLNLSSNAFSGSIPAMYGFLGPLRVLSLSGNRISGVIPAELGNCSELQVLELRSNHLSGSIPSSLSRLSRLRELDLGQNSLDGGIPGEISECSSLRSLLLDANNLSGSIPGSLSRLSNLAMLNLSSNSLTGLIPDTISELPGLMHLNLSNNNLQGQIPKMLGTRFEDPSVFAMNRDLCGEPLKEECSAVKRRKRMIILICAAAAGLCLVILCCCGFMLRLKAHGDHVEKKSSTSLRSNVAAGGETGGSIQKLVMFNNKITYVETLEATRQFDEENVLSRGKYGIVFKASFPDGMALAIRRLPPGGHHLDQDAFVKEAESLGKVQHRNITVLRGYYTGGPPDSRLLVYDYMPNGTLATLLQEATHQDGHVLNWAMRHLIALSIARGLAFLHSEGIVHGDVKPQNVLFDADFEAHLSEFGLDRLSTAARRPPAGEASSSSTPVATVVGTLGYVAPEVVLTGEATKEGDVYSYGAMLLEILTGKKPMMFEQDGDMVKWVKKQLQQGQISELVNPGLLDMDPEWEEFLLGLKVGLLCTAPDPVDRPAMDDVVFMLEGCRVGPEGSEVATTVPS